MIKLLNPKSVCVIGASRSPNKVGNIVLKNLLKSKLKVYPVNPSAKRILGVKCYESIKRVPGKVDTAVITLPAQLVPKVIEECGVKGVTDLIIISAGFKEAGNKALEDEVISIARKHGIKVLGPNVLGVIKPGSFNASFFNDEPREGGISFVSQSGALGVAVLDWAIKENIGFRYFISVGNMADINFAQLINELNNDAKTKVIALYIESLVNGRDFMKACSNSKKPVIILKAGVSEEGQRAASSHTGSLAGSNVIYESAFKQAGARMTQSFNDLIKSSQLINDYGLIGKRVLIIANAGGPSILMTDACINNGLIIPKLPGRVKNQLNNVLPNSWSRNNPIDVIGDALAVRYEQAFKAVKDENFYDCVIVILTPQAMTEVSETAQAILKFKKDCGKPVIPCFLGGRKIDEGLRVFKESGLFAFTEINEVADALKNAIKSLRI